MNHKVIGNNKEFAVKLLEALKILADPVKATLGPDGQPILIEKGDRVIMTKDGVSVAESIEVEDPVLNAMIQAIKESARKTNDLVGDGTTGAIVLTEAIIRNSIKYVSAGLITPQTLVNQIKECLPGVIKYLKSKSRKISNENDIRYVALISANNDKEIADKVTEAVVMAGEDGLLQLEDGSTTGIVVSKTEGYQINRGWSIHQDYAPRMMTNTLKQEVLFNNLPNILLYNGDMTDFTEFAEILKAHNKIDEYQKSAEYKQLVVIAHSFSGQIRQMTADNMAMNGLPVMLVETEMMGTPQSRIYLLDDLAVFSGGKVVQSGDIRSIIVRGNGPTNKKIQEGFLGTCGKIRQLKGTTTFYEGIGTDEAKIELVDIIKKQAEDCKSVWDKNLHRQRIAKLVDGIVCIEVGGTTELEIKERKDRVEDSLNATRAAIKEGVVAGGGVALMRWKCETTDMNCGQKVMSESLKSPLCQIISNTGQSPDSILYMISEKEYDYGYDALNKTMVDDVFKAGIIDPYLVVKTALENAVSISCEMLRGGGYCISKKGNTPSQQLVDGLSQPEQNI